MSSSDLSEHSAVPSPSGLPVPAAADPTYFLPRVDSGMLAGVLLRRAWMVMLPAALGGIAALWAAGRMPKIYQASGSVYVGSQAPVVLDIRAVAPEETRDLEQMRSVEQGMGGSTLLMRVMDANGLPADPGFAPPGTGRQAMLEKFAGRVKVGLRRGTRIIDLSVQDTDPDRARRLVESLVSEYEKWTAERQEAITRQAGEGLAREEERLSARMAESARKLQEFREANPVPGLEGTDTGGPARDALGALTSQLTQATAERLRLEAEFEACQKFDPTKPEALAGIEKTERGAEVLAQVRALQIKETEFGRVKERYLYKHPVYREAANEIEALKANLEETVRSAAGALEQRYQIAKENETKLAARVAQARGSAVEDEGVRERFRAMVREAEADRALHESVARRLRETTLAASVPASVLRWEDTPLAPERPHGPRKLVYAAAGGFIGFLCGLMLLVVAETSDRKVRDPAAAARATATPLLASVPSVGNAGDGMILMSDPSSAGAEAFRRLRVVLAPRPGSNTDRTVLFLSAKAGEGKSFCALNHATALAMQGHRTLLLDADLRSAGLSRSHLAGGDGESGLGGYLSGHTDPASACHATSLPNLYILASGPMRSDAAELLAGTRFPSLLEDAYRWFDRVVIDSPPVLAVSDALAIARYADRCCLVVSCKGSDRRELKRTAELIRGSGGNLVGFIWNECGNSANGTPQAGPVVPALRPGIQDSGAPGIVSTTSLTILPTFA
jgi:capsular exopolysaccharide synthesis family protein